MSFLANTLLAQLRQLDEDRYVLALPPVHQVAALVVHLVLGGLILAVYSGPIATRLDHFTIISFMSISLTLT